MKPSSANRIANWMPFVVNLMGALVACVYFFFIDPSSSKLPLLMIIGSIALLSAIEVAHRQD